MASTFYTMPSTQYPQAAWGMTLVRFRTSTDESTRLFANPEKKGGLVTEARTDRPEKFNRTHCVAVTGYVYHEGRFLLLKRLNPPLIWAPPGGRLEPEEDPCAGALREIREETGLETDVAGLLDYWFGNIGDYGKILSLDFIAISGSDEVRLSDEHESYVWVSLEELENGFPPLGGQTESYHIEDFKRASEAIQRWNGWKERQGVSI